MIIQKKKLIAKINLSYYQSTKGEDLIVLLHGWGASKEKLLPLGKALEKQNWQILIPDLPGFGKTKPPSKPWGVNEYAQFVLEIIAALDGKQNIYLFGHSFGGRLAIKIASLYPQKIKGIILCGSAGLSRANFFKRTFFLVIAKIGKVILPKSHSYRRLVYKLAREHDYEKTKGVMKQTFRLVIAEDLKPLLSKIKLPTLICWGLKDKETKFADAQLINSRIKNSQLISFPGLGHKLPYEEPRLLAKKITKWKEGQ
ncbi:MAG TPA: alpha/beta hydrolase [Patescibacteria group bacterium]|nr:alpha/beta hydrolase [Patescibacteria group bacterium]